MGKYDQHLHNTRNKISLFHDARFQDQYNAFLVFYKEAGQKLELAIKLFNAAYHNTTGEELNAVLEKFKNEMMLEMNYKEKMKEFVAFFQMYLDVEHSKMAEDGNTEGARSVIKDWLRCTPGMKDLLDPKRDGVSIKIGSDNTTNNTLSYNPRLRLEHLPAKWQELAMEIKEKKLLAQKKETAEIAEFEEVKHE